MSKAKKKNNNWQILFLLFILGASFGYIARDLQSEIKPQQSEIIVTLPDYETPVQPSPQSRIEENSITPVKDGVCITSPDMHYNTISDTHSMSPLMDMGNIVLTRTPLNKEEIRPGDIVIWQKNETSLRIIHRVVETGYDDKGWFAVTKGDNNRYRDEKIRYEEIKRVLIGIIY